VTVQITDITEGPVYLLGWDANRTVYPTGIASGEAVGTAQADASVAASGVAPSGVVGAATTVASAAVTGIDAGTGAAGTPALTAAMQPTGVASVEAYGSPQVDASIALTGLSSTVAFGTTEAFTSMNPNGFASTGAVGTPSTTAAMQPTGLASGVQFGDADTLATVFIIPGPVDPSNDFGDAVVTKKGWVFRTPVNTYQWRLFKEYEGISLLKESGTWSEVAHPDLERTRAADLYLAGGRDHVVSTSLKTELEGLGYTVTEEIVSTEEYLS
jgi:hypothetical protein